MLGVHHRVAQRGKALRSHLCQLRVIPSEGTSRQKKSLCCPRRPYACPDLSQSEPKHASVGVRTRIHLRTTARPGLDRADGSSNVSAAETNPSGEIEIHQRRSDHQDRHPPASAPRDSCNSPTSLADIRQSITAHHRYRQTQQNSYQPSAFLEEERCREVLQVSPSHHD